MNMFILLPEIVTCMHVCQDKYCMSPIHTVKIKCIAISEMKAMTNLKTVPMSVPYPGMDQILPS